jgi:hypothetical protein
MRRSRQVGGSEGVQFSLVEHGCWEMELLTGLCGAEAQESGSGASPERNMGCAAICM